MSIKYNNEIKKTYKKIIASKSKEEKQFFDTYGYWPREKSLAINASKLMKVFKNGEKWIGKSKTNAELGIPQNKW